MRNDMKILNCMKEYDTGETTSSEILKKILHCMKKYIKATNNEKQTTRSHMKMHVLHCMKEYNN